MFKKFFDVIRLHKEIKELKEFINLAKTNSEVCLQLMEHPIKSQKQIKNLLLEIINL